jgi:putative heme iron utilization protein
MAFEGTYKTYIQTPMVKPHATLVFKTDGDKLNGTAESMMGKTDFTGTVKGDEITFDMNITSPMGDMKLGFLGKVTGDNIAGEVKMGNFGSSAFKGKKV